tara:strand:+ start:261 stop:593 length:333 start_codon:yes stop_codon:yes gene_type:complete
MEVNMSAKTIRSFDKGFKDHMRTIVNNMFFDLLESETITFEDFEAEFINDKPIPKIQKCPAKHIINDEERCNCRIWIHAKQEYNRCNKKKKDGTRFCKIHQTNRNYGIVN